MAQWYSACSTTARGTAFVFTEPYMSTRLIDALFWVVVVACAIAQLFILRAVFRISPRSAPTGSRAPAGGAKASGVPDLKEQFNEQFKGQYDVPAPHRATELVWVVLPVLLLVLAFVGAWQAMHPVASLPDFIKRNGITVHQ